jgi:ubiquitin thioesterase OTU1
LNPTTVEQSNITPAKMRLRLRAPNGNHTVTLSDTATVGDLFDQITQTTQCLIYDLRFGFPPETVPLNEYPTDIQLRETHWDFNNAQLVVVPRDLEGMGVLTVGGKEGGALSHGLSLDPVVRDKELRDRNTAAAASLASSAPRRTGSNIATLSSLPSTNLSSETNDSDPPSSPLRSGRIILRVMPDDNSCLFRALGTAILGNALDSAIELRSIVTSAIRADPTTYPAVVLQRPPAEYCAWIMRESSWGGYIETNIIAQHFNIEVVTLDVKTLQSTIYNEALPGSASRKRCFIVYSGIHYDVLAFEPTSSSATAGRFWGGSSGGERDQYQFETDDDGAMAAARDVTRKLQAANYYTDTSSFTLLCNDCGWRGSGQAAAQEHGNQTGHGNFEEA